MAELLLDTQGTPSAPSAGTMLVYPDSGSLQPTARSNSRIHTLGSAIRNWNTSDVTANAADTYLTGSALTIPQHLMQAGTTFRWRFAMSKTAAGVAAPVWSLRVGTAGTTADTARCTFTSPAAQTAAIDNGCCEIWAVLRNTGASGVLAGVLSMWHTLAATGLANVATVCVQNTSAAFDTTTAGLIVGISVNPGTAGVWTHQLVTADLMNV